MNVLAHWEETFFSSSFWAVLIYYLTSFRHPSCLVFAIYPFIHSTARFDGTACNTLSPILPSPLSLCFSVSRSKLRLPQCHGSKAKTIKVYKYVNMVMAAQRDKQRNDIFCPRLANPRDTFELETLMTTYNAQMVKLWGHEGSSDAAQAPCGIALHANKTTHTHTHRGTQMNTCKTRKLAWTCREAGTHDAKHTRCTQTHTHTRIT